jgi:hypothetical protein
MPDDRRIGEAIGVEAAALWPGAVPGHEALAAAMAALTRNQDADDADPEDGDLADASARQWSDTVLSVRELLRGRRMVIIGGKPKAGAIRRIAEAFEVQEVDWIELEEHGTGIPMRAPIQRAETALVVVIIRLIGHLQAEEANMYCVATDKPCVRLPAGYNPEQIAAEIVKQASDRLAVRLAA